MGNPEIKEKQPLFLYLNRRCCILNNRKASIDIALTHAEVIK